MKIQTVSIVRDRGQLTIPDSIRTVRKWIAPASVVSITTEKPDEIVIKPHSQKGIWDWSQIWNSIELSRSFKGKRGNLSQFIANDRKKH